MSFLSPSTVCTFTALPTFFHVGAVHGVQRAADYICGEFGFACHLSTTHKLKHTRLMSRPRTNIARGNSTQLNSEWTARLVQSESTKSDVLSTHFPSHSSPSVTKRKEEEKRNTSSDNTIKPVQTAAATNRPYTPRGQMRDGLHRNTTHHPHPKSLRPPWSKPQTRLSNINEKTDTVLLPKPISNTSETLRKVTKSTGGT